MEKNNRKDRWENLRTIREIVEFIKENPEYKEFLDKPITTHNRQEGEWNNNPQVRFSFDHSELVLE